MARSEDHSTGITREIATLKVLRAMRNRDFVEQFKVRDSDGTIPVLVALHDDLVSDVVARVEARGGRANVIAAAEDHYYVLGFSREHAIDDLDGAGDDVPEVHAKSRLGMLIAYMRRSADRRFVIQVDSHRAEATTAEQISLPG